MFIQTVHNSLFRALEKDRNDVPVVKKKNRNGVPARNDMGHLRYMQMMLAPPVLYSFALANYESRS